MLYSGRGAQHVPDTRPKCDMVGEAELCED